jgi:hypothetical protein
MSLSMDSTIRTATLRGGFVALFVALSVAPAFAQIDFSGAWASLYHEDLPERLPGPELGDYSGLPLTDAARLRADSYDADRISVVPEYQCRPHGGDYQMRGLSNMRIDAVLDPVTQQLVAWRTRMGFQEMERTIWMDGRAHPDEMAPHTWGGFSTGTWQNNMLNVRTTHLKQNYIRRNGVPRSADATFTEHWVRHANYLTVVTVITDPAFLSEPLVRSQTWVNDPGQRMGRDICEYVEEVPRERKDYVPHHLPGANPYLREVADWYGLPYEMIRGGTETLYPEYRSKAPKPQTTKEVCGRYCTCGVGANAICLLSPSPPRP